MSTPDDDAITLDATGITLKDFLLPGRPRTIRYDEIVHAEIIEFGFWTGRHQLVGIGPFRPRLFFHWDRRRSAKSLGISLDLGRRLRVAITPDEPERVLAHVRDRIPTVDVDR